MTSQEIIKGLRCHAGDVSECVSCPAWPVEDGCRRFLCTAAADRLEEYVDRCARYVEEIMVLRGQQRNDPLTLNELKEMDGEPVWVVWLDGRLRSRWHIVWDGAFSPDYGKTWLAYRHKTEEVSNGKDG